MHPQQVCRHPSAVVQLTCVLVGRDVLQGVTDRLEK